MVFRVTRIAAVIIAAAFILSCRAYGQIDGTDSVSAQASTIAPQVPDLLPDQIRVDGLLSGVLDSSKQKFSICACAITDYHGNRTWLPSPRIKTVLIGSNATVTAMGQSCSTLYISAAAGQSYHVSAIGPDTGVGTPLKATFIALTPASAPESHFVQTYTSAPSQDSSQNGPPPELEMESVKVSELGGVMDVKVLKAKLGTVRIKVGLGQGQVGMTESLGAIAQRYGALAAINGSFFDAYVPGPIRMPDEALISHGEILCDGETGTLLGFTDQGEARMEPIAYAEMLHQIDPGLAGASVSDDEFFWMRVSEGIGCGPRLVQDGQIQFNPHAEGFSSGEMLNGSALRSLVGVTKDGWLLLVLTDGTLSQCASLMQTLGADQAMNLDGGSSSGIWLKGKYVREPGRLLSNALLILPNS